MMELMPEVQTAAEADTWRPANVANRTVKADLVLIDMASLNKC